MTKRAQLKSIVDGLGARIEAMDDKAQATREWAVKQIRKILHPKPEAPVVEKNHFLIAGRGVSGYTYTLRIARQAFQCIEAGR